MWESWTVLTIDGTMLGLQDYFFNNGTAEPGISAAGRWLFYVGIVLAAILVNVLWAVLQPGLWSIPGPVLAKFSRFYIVKHVIATDMHHLFIDLHKKHGPLVRYGPRKVSVADPTVIPIIYGVTTKFVKSPFYRGFVAPHEGTIVDNIFATRDPVWHKSLKSTIAPMYSLSNLRKLEKLVDECTVEFLRCMDADAGKTVDLGTWLQWYAFDVIGNITFAKTFNFLRDKADKHNILESLESGNQYNTIIGQAPALHSWLLANDTLMKFMMKFPEFAKRNPMATFTKMIVEATDALAGEGKEERGTHLEYLLRTRRENPGRLSDAELWSSITTNLFAGSDTTAMALRAVFYFLVKNPDCYAKLISELDEAYTAGSLSSIVGYHQGSELVYLQAVIKEAMRLHPGVSYPLERVVPQGGAEICGKFLPEGTIVGVHPWVAHRDKQVFGADADRFRPERWLDEDQGRLKAMERLFIPFGAGSRLCLGRHISMLEMTKLVPAILLRYNVEWSSDKDEWAIHGYWFAKQSGILMRLTPRDNHPAIPEIDG